MVMRNSEADKRRIALIIEMFKYFPAIEITGLEWQRKMVTVLGCQISLIWKIFGEYTLKSPASRSWHIL